MPVEGRLAIGLLLAIAMVYSATPFAIRVAARFNFYDKPAGYKGHARPTPYLGGMALVGGFFLVALVIAGSIDLGKTAPLLFGMTVLWVVGTIDDRRNISPWPRVAVEVALGAMLWALGLGWNLGVGPVVDLAVTVVWIVAVINAFNLFDNMDGTASTMALAVSACVVALGLVQGNEWIAVAAAVLCGACLGFLPHNLASPARIFLGDGGSMPLGFAAATLVMAGSADAAPAWQALVLGLLLVAVPATDTTLVILSRRRRGVGVLTGGQDHITHRTRRWVPTAGGVALSLGAVQALVSAVAIFAISGGATVFLVIAVLCLAAMATAISFLEANYEDDVATATPAGAARGRRRLPRIGDTDSLRLLYIVLIVAFAGVAGASALSSGFYRPGQWVPIGLVLIPMVTAVAIARPPRLSKTAIAGLVGAAGLGLWGLLSSAWAPSIAQAVVEGNRWLVLAAIFALALVLVRSDRSADWMTAGLAGGTAVVALDVVIRMLGGGGGDLFLGGRLHEPLGYVNAEGTLFLMGFWLWLRWGVDRRPWLAGIGVAAATMMAGLALLSESRGVAIAALVSVVVVLALIGGDRLRRMMALLVVAAAVAVAAGPLLDIYPSGALDQVHHGVTVLLLASLVAGLVWSAAVFGHARLVERRPAIGSRLSRIAVIGLVVAAVFGIGAGIASANRFSDYVSNQWHIFVNVTPDASGSTAGNDRLLSGAGNRYDYWRVAVDSFADHPLGGVGAGNYDRPYFEARRTSEDVRQPHSIELQALSELGIVGGLLLAAFLGCLVAAIWRARRFTNTALAATGAGVVVSWLVHTSVDWIHLFPGITAVALAMTAVLLRPVPAAAPAAQAAPVPPRDRRRFRMVAVAIVVGLTLAVAVASLAREGLADLFLDRAKSALAERPKDAIREADRSLRLDAERPGTYYVKAAALARFNRADDARETLLHALSKEPDNFVTWTLIGDLAVRRGRFEEAQNAYRHALRLNPEDQDLRRLAHDPRSALEPTG